MCGIVGVFSNKSGRVESSRAKSIFKSLMVDSQVRGKDSSGIAFIRSGSVDIFKDMVQVPILLKSSPVVQMMCEQEVVRLVGHSRMETNGSFSLNHNNQPVIKDRCMVIHNGIICNDQDVWRKYPMLKREYEVDTEIIASLMQYFLSQGHSIESATRQTFSEFEGSWAVAVILEELDGILLTTNTGSLHLYCDDAGLVAFASERTYLEHALKSHQGSHAGAAIRQIAPGEAVWIDFNTLIVQKFNAVVAEGSDFSVTVAKTVRKLALHSPDSSLAPSLVTKNNASDAKEFDRTVLAEYLRIKPSIQKLRRCSRCILPESMPLIYFDQEGICNYCHKHQLRETRGMESLLKAVEPYRRAGREPECIVSFSGGRDSSYALHLVQKELGLRAVAYSYDWGMLTDLGRRNQARMTGALGVEHFLVTPNIQKKRNYIRMNIEAWLKRPSLGMVPLFMAGDKQYFYYLNKTRKQTGIELVIYADNALEKTDFKYGFANVGIKAEGGKAYDIGTGNSLKLLKYYGQQYLSNPSYINTSILDTFTAYLSSYVVPKDYEYIFKYLLWEEREIEKTLVEDYNWELASDTKSSWRIGDGTAAFYNYIYYTVAGFTEQDTFRSNQIRENVINRDEALQLAVEGNEPRPQSILWYCDTIGVDALSTIRRINEIPKLFPN